MMGIIVSLVFFGIIVAAVWSPLQKASREKKVAIAARARANDLASAKQQALAKKAADPRPKFPIAVTTGTALQRGHHGAPPRNRTLWMYMRDLCQGILVIAPPGRGKTFLVASPYVQWMASSEQTGIFAFAVKRDFAVALENQIRAKRPKANIIRVGPGFAKWSLMDGLPPDAVAGFIRTVGTRGGVSDSTWSDAATLHTSSCALLLWSLTDAGRTPFTYHTEVNNGTDTVEQTLRYNFIDLHRIANLVGEPWEQIAMEARALSTILKVQGHADRAEQIEIALDARKLEFDGLGDKTRSSVLMSVNNVLGPLVRDVELRRTFAGDTDVRLTDLDNGACIILDIDIDQFRASAEFLFMLAFEQFSGFGMRRATYATNMVAFIGDEFSAYASARTMDFFALSRSAKIAPLLIIQSMSQLITKVGNRRETAHAIADTMGSLVVMTGRDPETISYVTQIVGQADITMESTSTARGTNTGTSNSTSFSPGSGGSGESYGESETTTTSSSLQQRQVFDAHLLRTLKSYFPEEGSGERAWAQAVGFVLSDGKIVDDVVTLWSPG